MSGDKKPISTDSALLSEEPAAIADATTHDWSEPVIFDEEGAFLPIESPSDLVLQKTPSGVALPVPSPGLAGTKPWTLKALDGSWFLEMVPTGAQKPMAIRGPMRIEAQSKVLRISGDIYVKLALLPHEPIVAFFLPESLIIQKNWYPAFPQSEYRWYFRSLGCGFNGSKLLFKFQRSLWNASTQEFAGTDNGYMEFTCKHDPFIPAGAPQPTLQMTGTAMIGGVPYAATATKTSPYYRGCQVEVDAMVNRPWPSSARDCQGSRTLTYSGVYRASGMDFRVVVNETNVPEAVELTNAELDALLSAHRSLSPGGSNWGLWLFIGSKQGSTFGIMFDTSTPPYREGAAGFYDVVLPNVSQIQTSAQGHKLGEVPLAFLRTLIHESGHVLNLYHPKSDVHNNPVGTTIMNQTGDVMQFASATNPYPCNASFAFDDHCRNSLIHSPDPQVKPGWKQFGWGHGSLWAGLPQPVDAAGLAGEPPAADGLTLELALPGEAHVGEFFVIAATLTNVGTEPRLVSKALNLSEGDLRLTVQTPSGQRLDVADVVRVCSDRRMAELKPGEKLTGAFQVFYTNRGFPFDQPGRYVLCAEMAVGDVAGSVARSGNVPLFIRRASKDEEYDLLGRMLDHGVGRAIALGDFGTDTGIHDRLRAVAESHADSVSGQACSMVLANALARSFRDLRTGKVLRQADEKRAADALTAAAKGRSAQDMALLAHAVTSAREVSAPLLRDVRNRLKAAKSGTYGRDDLDVAERIFMDQV